MDNMSDNISATDDNSRIAVMSEKVSRIQKDIEDIKEVLKTGYATKDNLIQVARETEARLGKLENSNNFWKFMSPTLGAVMGSIMTFLIIQYLMSNR